MGLFGISYHMLHRNFDFLQKTLVYDYHYLDDQYLYHAEVFNQKCRTSNYLRLVNLFT